MAEFCRASVPDASQVQLHVVDTFCGEPANETQAQYLKAHGGSTEKAFRANMKSLGVDVAVHAKASVEAARTKKPAADEKPKTQAKPRGRSKSKSG